MQSRASDRYIASKASRESSDGLMFGVGVNVIHICPFGLPGVSSLSSAFHRRGVGYLILLRAFLIHEEL